MPRHSFEGHFCVNLLLTKFYLRHGINIDLHLLPLKITFILGGGVTI